MTYELRIANHRSLSTLTALALLASLAFTAPALAKKKLEPAPSTTFEQTDVSNGRSQLIRSNAAHYWNWMKEHNSDPNLTPYLAATGTVAGDPHLGNFSVVPVLVGSQQVFRFVDIDFDDAGQAPFALDFIRYAITIEAEARDLKDKTGKKLGVSTKDLLEAYIAGLKGQAAVPPQAIRDALKTQSDKYETKIDEDVKKWTKNGEFEFEQGVLEPYTEQHLSESDIRSIFPNGEVQSIGDRVKDRGGDPEALRVWVLVRDKNHRKHIFELKGLQKAGVAEYQEQPSLEKNLAAVYATFWPGLSPESYKLVAPRPGAHVWLRERKQDLYKIDRGSEKSEDRKFMADTALYIANHLGIVHGRQTTSEPLKKALKSDPKSFLQVCEELVNSYLDEVEIALKHR